MLIIVEHKSLNVVLTSCGTTNSFQHFTLLNSLGFMASRTLLFFFTSPADGMWNSINVSVIEVIKTVGHGVSNVQILRGLTNLVSRNILICSVTRSDLFNL